MSIFFAILIFSFLIFIHEFGHFITAKLSGVQVNEFSMFMGPAIFKKKKGETLYSIRCIPIGGYCAMEGEDGESDNPRAFGKAAWWKRLIILVAGAAMNFIAGYLIMVIVLSCMQTAIPQIDFLRTGSTLAEPGGLIAGDTIVEVNGMTIETTTDFNRALEENADSTIFDLVVLRDGQQLYLQNVVMEAKEFPANEEGEAGLFYGIRWATRKLTVTEVIVGAWEECLYFVQIVWMSLGALLTGQAGLGDMLGPVGIVQQLGQVANTAPTALDAVIYLLSNGALIAVNLAVMNLLPIPALDGGRVVALLLTTAYESITHKKLDPKYEGYLHAAGMILLLGLMAVIMLKDIIFIFK